MKKKPPKNRVKLITFSLQKMNDTFIKFMLVITPKLRLLEIKNYHQVLNKLNNYTIFYEIHCLYINFQL